MIRLVDLLSEDLRRWVKEKWPSAYGSLALSACRKKGAKNWGKKS